MSVKTCPLTTALLLLLQTSLDLDTTNARKLADKLYKTPQTIQTDFGRISILLGTHGRPEALMYALKHDWIKMSPPPRRRRSERTINGVSGNCSHLRATVWGMIMIY